MPFANQTAARGLEFTITINAPPEFIFDFFEDGKKMVELVPEHFVKWEQLEPEENGIRLVTAPYIFRRRSHPEHSFRSEHNI